MNLRGGIGLALLGLLVLGSGRRSACADEDVAKFLLEQAKKAISVRKFDEAIVKLQRIPEEDPELIEAHYILGQVHEKLKAPGEALRAYRAFRDACRARGAALEKKLARLLKRAEKRIGTLGKGEVELEKLQRRFGNAVTGFALRLQEKDPDIAVDALRRVVAADPRHAAARKLLDELTGRDDLTNAGGDIDPKAVPIAGIKVWDDLLARRAIPPGTNTSYKRKVLTIDNEGNTIFWTDPYKIAPETFVYEMEFRFLEDHANGYLLGLAFARDAEVARSGGSEFVMAFAQKTMLTIVHASGNKNIDVGETALRAKEMGSWMHLTLAVEGRKVRVFLDGKQLLNAAVPGRKELSGAVGIFHQRCKAEIRMLRLGTKK